MTNETVTLDIPPHWTQIQDHIHYQNHSGYMLGKPRDVMAARLKTATGSFEGCLNHALEFMGHVELILGLRNDNMFRSNGLNDSPPLTTEKKILILGEIFNQQLRPWQYHKTFTELISHLMGVEKLRQQTGYKLSCSGQTIFLREISEVVRVMDQAGAKLDFTMADSYDPFYKRILETTVTSEERHKTLLKLSYQLVNKAQRAKERIAKQKPHSASKLAGEASSSHLM